MSVHGCGKNPNFSKPPNIIKNISTLSYNVILKDVRSDRLPCGSLRLNMVQRTYGFLPTLPPCVTEKLVKLVNFGWLIWCLRLPGPTQNPFIWTYMIVWVRFSSFLSSLDISIFVHTCTAFFDWFLCRNQSNCSKKSLMYVILIEKSIKNGCVRVHKNRKNRKLTETS